MEHLTDHQLIEKHLKGDPRAMELLLLRYMNPIYRFVFSYVKNQAVAEDVTQDVFLKVWKNLKKADKNKNVKSWIYTIAKNTALDFLKKKKSVPFSQFETEKGNNVLVDTMVDGLPLPDGLAMSAETKLTFKKALNQLSEKYKSVLLLYYYQYLNFREIAEQLDEPINTIKSRHRRGLVMLKKIVNEGAF